MLGTEIELGTEVELLGIDVLDAFRAAVVEGTNVVLREAVKFPSLFVASGDGLVVGANVWVVVNVLCGRKTT